MVEISKTVQVWNLDKKEVENEKRYTSRIS